MARRTSKKRRVTRSRSQSLLNILELYALTSIMTEGVTGYASPITFAFGGSDLALDPRKAN